MVVAGRKYLYSQRVDKKDVLQNKLANGARVNK
jgi:hypothetical protein